MKKTIVYLLFLCVFSSCRSDLKVAGNEPVEGQAISIKARPENPERKTAGHHLEDSLNRLNHVRDKKERAKLFSEIIQLFAEQDPEQGLAWIATIDSPYSRLGAYDRLFGEMLLQEDLEAALQLLEKFPEGRARGSAVAWNIHRIAKLDLHEAIRQGAAVSGVSAENTVAKDLARYLIKNGIEVDDKLLSQVPFGKFRNRLVTHLASHLVKEEPERAIQLINDLAASSSLKLDPYATALLARHFSESDPYSGILLQDQFRDHAVRKSFMDELGYNWAFKDYKAAESWALKSIERGEIQYLSGVMRGVFEWDQSGFIKKLQAIPDEKTRATVLLSAAEQLVQLNPERASSLILDAGAASEKRLDQVAQRLSGYWLHHDSLAASQWIDALPSGRTRDVMVLEMVKHMQKTGEVSEQIRPWMESIDDEVLQNKAVQLVK